MIVSRDGCLQALCNQCEFVVNDCEQNGIFILNQSELKSAMFASRADYLCKLLQIRVIEWLVNGGSSDMGACSPNIDESPNHRCPLCA